MGKHRTVFISYSWDNEVHRQWVQSFASRLKDDGIDVTLDQWHAVPGDHLPTFMATSVQRSDFVLIICTPIYKQKSEQNSGGVKYEGDIITSELFVTQNQRKFIPILREGEWKDASPAWLLGKYYVDLRGEAYSEANYFKLFTALTAQGLPPTITSNSVLKVTKKEMDKEYGTKFLEKELSKKMNRPTHPKGSSTAIAILDIDELTLINKAFGRKVGDEVLSVVAGIARQAERTRYYGRCGDDTFFSVHIGRDEVALGQMWDDINRRIREFQWNNVAPELRASCSVGYAVLQDGEDAKDWIIRGIRGMLEAKRRGGNKVIKGPKFAGKLRSISMQLAGTSPQETQQRQTTLNLRDFFS